jgi:hypothetical protein
MVQRGDLAKSSFAFATYEDEWDNSRDGYPQTTRGMNPARRVLLINRS